MNIFFIGSLGNYITKNAVFSATGLPYILNELKNPDDFSAYLKEKPSNAYEVGVVVCDLKIAKNRSLALYDEYINSYCDGFLKFIFIDNGLNATEISELIKKGVSIILSNNFSEKKFIESIEITAAESNQKRNYVIKNITAVARFGNLTSKEISILSLMLNGLANKEIAKKLGNSSRTIELHRASVFDKMNVKNAIELALMLTN